MPRRIERPALLISTSTPPYFSTSQATILSQLSMLARSAETVTTSPPLGLPASLSAASISPLAASSLSWSRAAITVIAPACAILCAAARPMPEEPPVTSTTLPLTWPLSVRSMKRSGSRWRSQ
jgi:hypothetical protein